MAPTTTPSTPLLTSRFAFQRPVLLLPRLHLYPDRLELRGWHWFERYRRSIPLERILQVDTNDGALVVWLVEGQALRLQVEDADAWRDEIDEQLS